MPVISIRLSNKLLDEVNMKAQALHISRAEYIRRAIERMNNESLDQERKQQLIHASLRVRNQSMEVNAEFSQIENDPKD